MAASSSGVPDPRVANALRKVPGLVETIKKDNPGVAKDLGLVTRRLSKKVRLRMAASARGKKSASTRGVGRLSRSSRALEMLPSNFRESVESFSHPSRPSGRPVWSSPGGSKYRTFTLKRKLEAKGMPVGNADSPVSSVSHPSESDGEVIHPGRKLDFADRMPVVVEDGYFVGQVGQLQTFVDNLNSTLKCRTEGCQGILVPLQFVKVGLGGGLRVVYGCNGCAMPRINFDSSTFVDCSRRLQVSLALCLSMLVSGNTFAGYDKPLGQGLGLETVSDKSFYKLIQDVYPITRALVKEHCEAAKTQMRELPDEKLGSSKRAVTQADGTWGTRGFHSKNCTVTIRNSLNNSLLYVTHLCMKGGDTVTSEEFPLFKGTAKSGEGIGLDMLWEQVASDGIVPEVHWQDGDSTSMKSFRAQFPDEEKHRVMLCSGHVARAHQNALSDLKGKKSTTKMYRSKHQGKFPQVCSVKCCCEGKQHKKGCGCISDAFIRQARINFFCCIVQADKDPDALKERLSNLGKYHARDVHSWKDRETKKVKSCDFHPAKCCSCKKCKTKAKHEEPLCGKGTKYKSRNALTCPLHSLMYEIETDRRAEQAKYIIHPELGRGNSNLPEASHNVMLRLRSKDIFLSRLHYIVKTDMGLLQSCVSWEQETRPFGTTFIHWTVEVFKRMNLPIPPGMVRNVESALRKRKRGLEKAKTEEKKQRRIALKAARVLDSEERKQFVKQRAIQHSYGDAEVDTGEDSDGEAHSEEDDARSLLEKDSQSIRKRKKQVGRVVGLSSPARTSTSSRKRTRGKSQATRRGGKRARQD
ncbi:uncharacterized protein LOC144910220 [Branchiostoma floridae x Branchiostoma belcheri]